MTRRDAPHFFKALGKLAVMARLKLDRANARAYYEALQDVPLDLLLAAMTKALAHAGDFMPASERIRELVDDVQDEQIHNARLRLKPDNRSLELGLSGEEPVSVSAPCCPKCSDAGHRQACACLDPQVCEQRQGDYCAAYMNGQYRIPVKVCECAGTNPTILLRKKLTPVRYSKRQYGR